MAGCLYEDFSPENRFRGKPYRSIDCIFFRYYSQFYFSSFIEIFEKKIRALKKRSETAFWLKNKMSLRMFNKKVPIKFIRGHFRSKNQKRSEYGKLKLKGLLRDHPPAYAISKPASMGVKVCIKFIF